MTDLSTFNVSDVIQKLADSEKINVSIEGIDDICYGLVISSDKSFVDFLSQHRGPYNFQVVDGDPIRIVRRAIGDDLAIDYTINETDCLPASQGQPAVQFSRLDPQSLPGETQVSYIDVDREFTTTTQIARHRHAKQSAQSAAATIARFGTPTASTSRLIQAVSIDFIITADQARAMAFDIHFRTWAQATSVLFEHPDLSIEPGDTVTLTADAGIFTLLVQESTITTRRSNQIKATALLTSSGIAIAGGSADPFSLTPDDDFASWLLSA